MRGRQVIGEYARHRAMIGLLALALLLRILIPAGWMPSTEGGFYITLCNSSGATSVWMGADGSVHKQKPLSKDKADQPCVFSALGALLALPEVVPALPVVMPVALISPAELFTVAIGRGLAAPPPPPTGPPASL